MKRTSTINLGGMIFNIDEDAYQALNQYFTDLSRRFPEDEKEEILRDIESRMSELFSFKLQNRNVIDINDVQEVIEVIGRPEQFDDESSQNSEENSTEGKKPFNTRPSKEYRKLYRDSTDKIIGGVASGLAAYFGIDPVVMRILFVVLAFASLGWGILIYLIFLIAMPEANTKAQLLEMKGIEPSLENIDNFNQTPDVSQKKRGNTLGNILKVILIIIGVAIAVTFSLCVLGICIAIFVALLTHTPGSFGNFTDIALLTSCALFFLCPVIGIIVFLTRALRQGEKKHKWVGWTILVLWILSFFGIIGFGIEAGKQGNLEQRLEKTSQYFDNKWGTNSYKYEYFRSYPNKYDSEEIDSLIKPLINVINDDKDYDISISSNPVSGTNVHIKSSKRERQDITVNDTINHIQ